MAVYANRGSLSPPTLYIYIHTQHKGSSRDVWEVLLERRFFALVQCSFIVSLGIKVMYPARAPPTVYIRRKYIYGSLSQPYILHKQKEPCSSHPPTHPTTPTHPSAHFPSSPRFNFSPSYFPVRLISAKSYGFPKPRRLPSFRIKCRGYKYQLRAARLYFISVSARAVRMSCLLLPSRFYSPTFLFVGRAPRKKHLAKGELPLHTYHIHTRTRHIMQK